MSRYHRQSEYGLGPRQPLTPGQQAAWQSQLEIHRRAGRVTALHQVVAKTMCRMLGVDGRLDPAVHTIATYAGASPRTVARALRALRDCGMLTWARRLVRCGWRVAQTSSAYVLTIGKKPEIPVARTDCQPGRGTLKQAPPLLPDAPVTLEWIKQQRERLGVKEVAQEAPSDRWAGLRAATARRAAALAKSRGN